MLDLSKLKKTWRALFCVELGGIQVFFRLPTWREHDIYTKVFSFSTKLRGKLEDEFFQDLCLDDDLINRMHTLPAGIISSIVSLAIYLSGNELEDEAALQRINSDLSMARTSLQNNPYEQFIVFICQAFPSLTPRDVEDLPYHEVLRYVTMAETILQFEKPIDLSPREEKSLTDKIFEDARKAGELDIQVDGRGRPAPADILDAMKRERGINPKAERAQQQAMLRRLQEHRTRRS